MADQHKYYYMRLKENFFDDDAIKILESMPDGYLYSNILLKMYLRSLKSEGRLMMNDLIPYDAQMLAAITGHQIGTIQRALEIFKTMRLIEILDNGAIYMMSVQSFIGQTTTEADRKREYSRRIAAEKKGRRNLGEISDISRPELEIEKELNTEIKKPKAPKAPAVTDLIEEFSEDEDVKQALRDFVEMRRSIKKPLTPRAMKGVLARLQKLSDDPQTQVRILEQSIEHDWQTVYELKEEARPAARKTSFHNFEQRESAGGDWSELDTFRPEDDQADGDPEKEQEEWQELLGSFRTRKKKEER